MGYIYIDIKNEITDRIRNGIYKQSEKLPSERVLSEEFKASRMTIRQAIIELENDGLVYRKKGSGTFVSTHQYSQLNLKSFTETVKEQGFEPSTVIIEQSIVHNLKDISEAMGLKIRTKFYKIKRVRLGDRIPIALETVYIPCDKCEDLFSNDLTTSLYTILTDDYGYEIESASYNIDACMSNQIVMRYFKVLKPVVLLKISGVTYDVNGINVMYEESYYRSDLYNYKVDIFKRGK